MSLRPISLTLSLSSLLAAISIPSVAAADAARPGTTTLPEPPAIDTANDEPWAFPVRPDNCDDEQLATGDVRACVVMGWNDPTSRGWPAPPAPRSGDPDQWAWNGYSYSGSPALAEWEESILSENANRIGRVRAGRLQTHRDVAVLFEGFLTDVVDNGYHLDDAHGYGYRCTGGSGGWDCPSGNSAGLSLHAWGLAIDINAGTNPIVTLRDADGGNACEIPMETDMPQWVIQTAEKWGLYWGGYGFSGDCSSPDDVRSSTYRDPPHFEFRGTPDVAAQIARFNLRNNPDLGCYDVVDTDGTERLRCNREFSVEAGWRVAIDPGAPEGAVAAVVNLTATGADEGGFLTLESCAARTPGMPATSNVNYEPGQSVANLATVALDSDGRFCIYHDTSVHAVVDVVGFIAAPTAEVEAGWFTPIAPVRVGDTRKREVCHRDGSCESGPIVAGSVATLPVEGERVLLANLTVTDNTSTGYVSAGDCSLLDGSVPEWSNLNFAGENARANLAIIDTSLSASACAYTWADTHLIVDLIGEISVESGLGWQPVEPERVLDTRKCADDRCAIPVGAGEVIAVDLGDGVDAAIVNVTATGAAEDGFATLAPCAVLESVTGMPSTSTINVDAGATAANLAIASDDGSGVCLWASEEMHLIVDVQSLLVPERDLGFVSSGPSRVYDGRRGG